MIRSHFGLQRNPFDTESLTLLPHQQEIFDILLVHAQQGGLCLLLGEPGTGKSVLKQTLLNHDPKRMITPVVNRTLHTYHNTLRILCGAFQIEFEGRDHRCEKLLVQEAFKIHRAGKMLVPIIDDAHLMPPASPTRSSCPAWDPKPPKPSSWLNWTAPLWATTPSAPKPWPSSSVPARAFCAAPATFAWVRSSKRSATRPASWTSNKSTACSSNPIGGKTMTTRRSDPGSARGSAAASPLRQPRWTREQIRAARVAPLLPLLQKRGLQLIEKEAANFELPAYPGLILKDSYWRWPQRELAGNAIDFFVQVLGLSFHDAMRQITAS